MNQQFRESYKGRLRDEIDALTDQSNVRFLTEHNEDGTHRLGFWDDYPIIWRTNTDDQPVLGNGRLIGRYMRLGNTVWFFVRLTIGSTTTMGTGDFLFTMPVPSIGTIQSYIINSITSDAGVLEVGSGLTLDTFFIGLSHDGTGYTSTTPFTWASGDDLIFQGWYEVTGDEAIDNG